MYNLKAQLNICPADICMLRSNGSSEPSVVAAYLFLIGTIIVRLIQQAAATQLEMCIQADTWTVLCAVLSA